MKQQAKSWKCTENSQRTLVDLNKILVKFEKEIDSLERQQITSVTNIANYQQAMKMSWRRLEEKRAESSTRPEHVEKKKESGTKEMMFQSKTKLYVNKTPAIYNPHVHNPDSSSIKETGENTNMIDSISKDSTTNKDTGGDASMDDSVDKGLFLHNSFRKEPPPTCLNSTGYYASFRHPELVENILTNDCSTDNILRNGRSKSKSPDRESTTNILASSSQPLPIQSSIMNKKDTLLRASTMMNLESSTSSLKSFAEFYGQSQNHPKASGLASNLDLAASMTSRCDSENLEDEEKFEMSASSCSLTLAEMFDEIRQCRYIRHNTPAPLDEH